MQSSLRQTPCGFTSYSVARVRSASVTHRSSDSVNGDAEVSSVALPSKMTVGSGAALAPLEIGHRKTARARPVNADWYNGFRKKSLRDKRRPKEKIRRLRFFLNEGILARKFADYLSGQLNAVIRLFTKPCGIPGASPKYPGFRVA